MDRMLNYQQATGLTDGEVLAGVVPVSLTDQAARWFCLTGHRSRTMEEFRARFREEFLPADYDRRLRRELELRTQHPDESLLEYVRAMDELYRIADPSAPNGEKVERVTRQAHPTFAAYLRGVQFRDLDKLASAAKRIQADILASHAYRPPPPASQALEPRCAWNGDTFRIRSRGAETVAFSDGQLRNGWELSDRALDPYTYAMRAAHAARNQDVRNDRPKKPLETPSAELPYQPVDRAERKSSEGNPSLPVRPPVPPAVALCAAAACRPSHPLLNNSGGLSGEENARLSLLLNKYDAVFTERPGCTTLVRHKIETGDAVPWKCNPRPVSLAKRKALDNALDELLDTGVVERSNSPWGFPEVLVPKKDGTTRLCVDYRRLNEVTWKDAYPLPSIPSIVSNVGGAKYCDDRP
ncbi:uncharacterized protein LOC144119238 [Amblyomma americanum]